VAEFANLRDRKKARVRNALEQAAFELFERHGFSAISVAEIADAADMSPRNFFRYFSSKEEVVFANSSAHLSVLRARVRARPAGEPVYQSLKQALISYADFLQDYEPQAKSLIKLIRNDPALRARRAQEVVTWSEGLLDELTSRGRLRVRQLSVEVAIAIALTTFGSTTEQWQRSRTKSSLPALVERAFQTIEQDLLKAPAAS
jgi:AcrR family transcriptional regulator